MWAEVEFKVKARTGAIVAGVIIIIIIAAAAVMLSKKQATTTATPAAPATTPTTTATAATTTAATTTKTSPTTAAGAKAEKTITINVGLLVDLSGPTSDVGRPYAKGAEAAFKYFNEKGIYTKDGVRIKINYIKRDYGYNPTRAEERYREFRDKYGVVAIVGWGTADTEKLSDQTAKDKIPYISASYSAKLVVKPYNFFPNPDYSTQACAAVEWMASKKKGATLVLLYDHKIAYSKSPVPAIKAMAKKLGLKVYEVDFPLKATDADAERAIQQAKQYNPDFIWCGNTISSCSRAGKALAKYGLKAIMVSNVWGFDERFPKMAGGSEKLANHVAGVSPWIWPEYKKTGEGYKMLYEAAKMAGFSESDVNLRFLQGFLNVWLLVKALERLSSTDLMQKKGEAIKEVLEATCKGEPINFGDIASGIRYCPGRHLAFTSSYIVIWDGKDFKFEGPITPKGIDCVKVTVEGG